MGFSYLYLVHVLALPVIVDPIGNTNASTLHDSTSLHSNDRQPIQVM